MKQIKQKVLLFIIPVITLILSVINAISAAALTINQNQVLPLYSVVQENPPDIYKIGDEENGYYWRSTGRDSITAYSPICDFSEVDKISISYKMYVSCNRSNVSLTISLIDASTAEPISDDLIKSDSLHVGGGIYETPERTIEIEISDDIKNKYDLSNIYILCKGECYNTDSATSITLYYPSVEGSFKPQFSSDLPSEKTFNYKDAVNLSVTTSNTKSSGGYKWYKNGELYQTTDTGTLNLGMQNDLTLNGSTFYVVIESDTGLTAQSTSCILKANMTTFTPKCSGNLTTLPSSDLTVVNLCRIRSTKEQGQCPALRYYLPLNRSATLNHPRIQHLHLRYAFYLLR